MGILCCAPGYRGFLRRRRRGKNRYWPRGAQDGTVQAGRGPTIAFPCCECEVAAEEAARGLNGPRDHKVSQLPPAAASATLAGLQPLEPRAEGTGRCHKTGCRGCRGHRSIKGSARWALKVVVLWSLSPSSRFRHLWEQNILAHCPRLVGLGEGSSAFGYQHSRLLQPSTGPQEEMMG